MSDRARLETILKRLEEMPGIVETLFAGLEDAVAAVAGPDDAFSPVEHCWHLVDLEREGFGSRIHRLLAETDPVLPDFDGDRIARERNYGGLSMMEGMKAFREARAVNVAALRRVVGEAWTRSGTQEGEGRVSLRDIPSLMAAHDASHLREMEGWLMSSHPKSR